MKYFKPVSTLKPNFKAFLNNTATICGKVQLKNFAFVYHPQILRQRFQKGYNLMKFKV